MFHLFYRLDNKSAGRQSVSSANKPGGIESDTDSMAEYGDGDTGKFCIFLMYFINIC